MAKEAKTNAMRFLEKNKIPYSEQTYECDEFVDGVTTANALGQPLDMTFKTLVAHGKSGNYYCFLIPVDKETWRTSFPSFKYLVKKLIYSPTETWLVFITTPFSISS